MSEFDWSSVSEVDFPDGSAFDWNSAAVVDEQKNPKPNTDRSLIGTLGDIGTAAAKTVVGTGEAAVGVLNIPTFGHFGKALQDGIGYDPKRTQEELSSGYSDAQQAAQARAAEGKGFIGSIQSHLENPSTILTGIGESVGPMLLGGAGGKGVGLATKAPAWLLGGVGEGVVGAGSAAEQIRQGTEDGTLSGKQVLSALGSGVGTGALGVLGGKIANSKVGKSLSLGDIDTALVSGSRELAEGATQRNILSRVLGGAVSEGLLEELPQSVQEQMWQNFATDRPIMEGVPESAGVGLLLGAAMGGGFNAATRQPAAPTPKPTDAELDQSLAGLQSTMDQYEGAVSSTPLLGYTPEVIVAGPPGSLADAAGTAQMSGAAEVVRPLGQNAPLKAYQTTEAAQDYIAQQKDPELYTVIRHPRAKAGFAVVPKQQAEIDGIMAGRRTQEQTDVRTQQLAQEEEEGARAKQIRKTVLEMQSEAKALERSVTKDTPVAEANAIRQQATELRQQAIEMYRQVSQGRIAQQAATPEAQAANTQAALADNEQTELNSYGQRSATAAPGVATPGGKETNNDVPGSTTDLVDSGAGIAGSGSTALPGVPAGVAQPAGATQLPGSAGVSTTAIQSTEPATLPQELSANTTVTQQQPAPQPGVAQAKRAVKAGPHRRNDLVGAILRVTGNRGLSSKIALDTIGDTANRAGKLRGLFSKDGVQDLDDTATLLRVEEGYDVRDGNHLAELIREASFGEMPTSMETQEENAAKAEEQRYKENAVRRAKELGLKGIGGKRTLKIVEAAIAAKEAEIAAEEAEQYKMEAQAERSAIQAESAYTELLGLDMTEADWMRYYAATVDYRQEDIDRAKEHRANRENDRAQAGAYATSDGSAQEGAGVGRQNGQAENGTGLAETRARGTDAEFGLTGQTEAEIKVEEAKQKADEGKISKAQADREQAAVPFTLAQETQAKPVGVQGTLTEAPAEAAKPEAISDFGEKIGGARKDKASALREALEAEFSDNDIATQPLSKIWPKETIDQIEDTFVAAVAHAARNEIPAKPRKSYAVTAWVAKVKMLRDMTGMMLRGDITKERFAEALKGKRVLEHFAAKVALLEAIGRENWGRIGKVEEYPDAYHYTDDGKKVPSPVVRITIDDKPMRFEAKNVADVLDKVREALGEKAVPKKMQFEVRGQLGRYAINKKGDSLYRKLKTFETSNEAFDYLTNNYDDLVSAWEAVKDSDNIKESDVRSKENRPRTAKDWRKGKNVTPEQFGSELGFRGVEFGNWVSQGQGGKDRQGMLNQAYDALMDLADIIGVPAKAMSLNGSLGLGFGSRGSGKFAAHFESDMLVINLTKTRGAGSLAHEWFHALDNYFQSQRGKGADFITNNPENYYVHKQTGQKLPARAFGKMIEGEYDAKYGSMVARYRDRAQWELKGGVRPEVAEAFADLVKTLNDSPMAKRAALIDKGKSGGYWSRIIERGARSFENYVIHKMALKGYQNDYLANVVAIDDFARDQGRYPYLLEEEIQPVAESFDNLFATIQTKETDKGVALFSRTRGTADAYSNAQEANARKQADAKARVPQRDTRTFPTRSADNEVLQSVMGESAEAVRAEELKNESESGKELSKQQAQFITQVARLFKKRVVFFQGGSKGDGFYQGGDTIYIGTMSSVAHLRVLGHELTHAMKQQAGDAYEKMLGAVSNLLTDTELSAQFKDYFGIKLDDAASLDMKMSELAELIGEEHAKSDTILRDFLAEEWMADLSGNRFAERSFWTELFNDIEAQHGSMVAKNIVNRLRMAFNNALNKILQVLKGGEFAVDQRLQEHLAQIRLAVKDGFVAYEKAAKAGQLKDTGAMAVKYEESKRTVSKPPWMTYDLKAGKYKYSMEELASMLPTEQLRKAKAFRENNTTDAKHSTVRKAMEWKSQTTNDTGPVYQGDGFTIEAMHKIDTTDDFQTGVTLPWGHITFVEGTAYDFAILDDSNNVVGMLQAEVNNLDEINTIHDIKINDGTSGKGLGTKVVETIMASTYDQVRLIDVLSQSEKFWDSLGAGHYDEFKNANLEFAGSPAEARGRAEESRRVRTAEENPAAGREEQSVQEASLDEWTAAINAVSPTKLSLARDNALLNEVPNLPQGNRTLDSTELRALRRAAASVEKPEKGLFLFVTPDGRLLATGYQGKRISPAFAHFARQNNLKLEAYRAIPSRTTAMPDAYREDGATYFEERDAQNKPIERTGLTRFSLARFSPDQQEANTFKKDLARWIGLPEQTRKSGLPLTIGRTPYAMLQVGAEQYPVQIDRDTLIKLVRPHGENPKGHGLTKDQIAQLPEQLANPIAIFESAPDVKTKARRDWGRVVLTSLTDSRGEQITVAVHLAKGTRRSHIINDISSMYGRPESQIENWVDAGLTLWLDDTRKETSPAWLTTGRLQLPTVVQAAQGLNITLQLKSQHVNEAETKLSTQRTIPAEKLEKVSTDQFSYRDEPDEFYYHVTSEPNAANALKQGLIPNKKRMYKHGMYQSYSTGKTFLTDRDGVMFWMGKIEDQLFDQFDDPPEVAVLRVKKSELTDVEPDTLGTQDSRHNAYKFSTARGTSTWDAPEPSKIDDIIYSMQDKQVDMKRVVGAIMKAVGTIKDQFNPYLQEELFHGRSAKRVTDFLGNELRPLTQEMVKLGVEMSDFEEYLWNRHAEERNIQISKINPQMPDGGSGLNTADARAYLAGLTADKRSAYEALAKRVDAINANTRQMLVDSGLEKQETIDAWSKAYQSYVPLQREDVETGGNGTGQGFSIRGSASKRAVGSGKPVVNILANIAQQRERQIVRIEKNRVATALLGLAVENKNPDFWDVDNAPKEKLVETRGGKDVVVERVSPMFRSQDNVVMARINGEDHFVVFNERDPRATRMAMAIKNLDADQLGRVLSLTSQATRYISSINTQYNPFFGVINLLRDTQGAMLNLSTTPLQGQQAKVVGYTISALRGIYSDLRAHRAGKAPTSAWAQLWEEFQNEGGQTGYRDQYANATTRGEAIASEIRSVNQNVAKKGWHAVFNWLSDYNETMENATRLAAYKAAKENGMSNQQAASLAKNLTVNFNRKGQVATQMGALYAFFNASMQGTARLAETMRGPMGKKILAGGILLGSMQAMLLAAAGFGDDEPPEFIRERNLIIPTGDGKYITIPMPLGFHVLPNIGRIPAEFALSGFKDPMKRLASFVGVFTDTFNPMGSAGFSLQTILPSVIDPFAALAENKDWTGKPIAKTDMNGMSPTPGHSRAKDTATIWSKYLSHAINWVTGGTEFKQGLFSPTPDQIDYLIGQGTGGVGREAGKVAQVIQSAVTGEDLPLYKVPLVGRFVGDTEGQSAEGGKFYSAIKRLNEHERELKGLRESGRGAEAMRYLRDNPEARMVAAGNAMELQMQKLRKAKRDALEKGNTERVKQLDVMITGRMKAFNQRVKGMAAT